MIITSLPMLTNPVLLYSPSHVPWATLAAPLRLTVRQQEGEELSKTRQKTASSATHSLVDRPTQLTLISHLWIFIFVSISEQISKLQIWKKYSREICYPTPCNSSHTKTKYSIIRSLSWCYWRCFADWLECMFDIHQKNLLESTRRQTISITWSAISPFCLLAF